MANTIYILSDFVQSGKTTLLKQFIAKKLNIAGVLAPTINGLRKIVDIKNNIIYDFEKVENTASNDILIGKFIFSSEAFMQAQNIISTSLAHNADYIIVDEIGKLELQNIGLEPQLSELIKQANTNLILVIRNYLLQECIVKYNLQNAIILNLQEFKTKFNL